MPVAFEVVLALDAPLDVLAVRKLVVPVGARESLSLVGEEADEIVCHTIPHELLGLLTEAEGRRREPVFDIPLLARRLEGAGHLFAEPGTLETVARLVAQWFTAHLTVAAPPLAAAGER